MSNRHSTSSLITGALVAAILGLGACSIPTTGVRETSTPRASTSDSGTVDVTSPGESLVAAAVANDAEQVRRLLDAGVSANHRGTDGRPVLVSATRANAVDAARELIRRGADVNAKDQISDSAFLYAGAEGLNDILELTLENGADVGSTNRYGGTALIPACEHAHVETVRLLLDAKVAVDHVNDLGWTCLLETVILGTGGPEHQEVVRLVIDAGGDVSIADSDGTTALEHARRGQQSAVVGLLESAEPPR